MTFDLAPPLRRGGPELLDPSGFQAWLDTWDGEIAYEIAELTIGIGGDIAYCHSLDHLTGTRTDGKREDFWTRATVGLRKTGDGWKVTHEHTSVPFYMDGTARPAFRPAPVTAMACHSVETELVALDVPHHEARLVVAIGKQ